MSILIHDEDSGHAHKIETIGVLGRIKMSLVILFAIMTAHVTYFAIVVDHTVLVGWIVVEGSVFNKFNKLPSVIHTCIGE